MFCYDRNYGKISTLTNVDHDDKNNVIAPYYSEDEATKILSLLNKSVHLKTMSTFDKLLSQKDSMGLMT